MYSRYKRFSRYGSQILTHELKDVDFNRGFEQGPVVKFTIPRKGDLVKEIYFHCKVSPPYSEVLGETTQIGFTSPMCFYMFQKIDLVIGDTIIETLTPDYMECMMQLTNNEYKNDSIAYSVGNIRWPDDLVSASTEVNYEGDTKSVSTRPKSKSIREYVFALPFYFHKNPAYALPLCALTKQEIEVHFHLRGLYNFIHIVTTTVPGVVDPLSEEQIAQLEYVKFEKFNVHVDYVYIDDEERDLMLSRPLTTFINQNQLKRVDGSDYISVELDFINPIKEIFFFKCKRNEIKQTYHRIISGYQTITDHRYTDRRAGYSITANRSRFDPIDSIELVVDNDIILSNTVATYSFLNQIQPFLRHTMVPKPSVVRPPAYIYMYSFALDPENNLPTGYLNPNVFKKFVMNMYLNRDRGISPYFIYARTINILTIRDGTFSLLFENPILKDFY